MATYMPIRGKPQTKRHSFCTLVTVNKMLQMPLQYLMKPQS